MFKKKVKLEKQGFMQSVFILVFSQIIIKILGFFYKLYLTNKEGFGDKGNAIYGAVFSIYALLLTVSSAGVPSAISKIVSSKISNGDYRGAHRVFKIALMTFSLIGLIGTFLMYFGSSFIAKNILDIEEAEASLIMLSPSIFFVSIICTFRGYFNGRQMMKATANSQTIEQLFKTLFTIIIVELLFVFYKADTKLMTAGANLATTIATFLSFIYLFIYYKERRNEIGNEIIRGRIYKGVNYFKVIKNILFVSIPISLSSILISLNRNIDSSTIKRCLSKFLSKEEALLQYGILSGKVDNLITFPLSFNIAFSTTLVPTITYLYERKDYKGICEKVSLSILITILITLPCCIGFIVFAEPILKLLFPNASSGALMLKISSISIIFTALVQTINGALQGLGKLKEPIISLFIGVVIKFLLNITLIRIEGIGIYGAIFASIISHIISFSISFYILKKNISIKLSIIKYVVKPVFACIIMGITSYYIYVLLSRIIIGKMIIILTLLFAILIYIILIIILKIFTEKEILSIPMGDFLMKFLKFLKIY